MQQLRQPAVAGTFYPADRAELQAQVTAMLAAVSETHEAPKALIVPHAGYVYSGPVAASAYAALRPLRGTIETVVLLGPSHRVYFRGLAAPDAYEFGIPTARIAVDQNRIDDVIEAFPFVQRLPQAHQLEHSLEVHLPFLVEVLGAFRLVPLVVGDATPQQVEQVLDRLWGDARTLIVISSDLSHYHDYATARRLDGEAASAIEALEPQHLNGELACGYLPVSGLLLAARRHHATPERVDLRNSGDTAGPRDQVVGYGAWLFHEHDAPRAGLSEAQKVDLKALALASIRHGLEAGEALGRDAFPSGCDWPRDNGAAFVTLKKAGQLRGCIGSLSAHRPLAEDVSENAYAAAFRDPRFPPLRSEELDGLEISISVLTPPQRLSFASEQELLAQLRPGVDGLILTEGGRRGTFLPSVWESYPEPAVFLRHLKMKAGLPPDYWSDTVSVERYETLSW